MGLYKLFSYSSEIQYKNSFLSKAMLFTIITTALNFVLPFIIAYRSRGFWLKTHSFYEQPYVHFTYEYMLVAETEDPSQTILCSNTDVLHDEVMNSEENCARIQVQEFDHNKDGKNDLLDFNFFLYIPPNKTLTSILLLLALDLKLKSVCPLHMQSAAVVNREFSTTPTGLVYFGDITLYQTNHLPCWRNHLDTEYNSSIFINKENNDNIIDSILLNYYKRQVTTQTRTLYSRIYNGQTGTMSLNISFRIPEFEVRYKPSFLQELKWAWPQYLSIAVIFFWIFNRVKRFVFNNRLLMAWKIEPEKIYKQHLN